MRVMELLALRGKGKKEFEGKAGGWESEAGRDEKERKREKERKIKVECCECYGIVSFERLGKVRELENGKVK